MPAATEGLPELTFTRTFEAPRELVFRMWTDPYHLAQWWGPTVLPSRCRRWMPGSAAASNCTGGRRTAACCGRSATFHEVAPHHRIVFDSNLVDAAGNKLIEVVNTITLEDVAGKTLMTLHVKVLRADPQAAGSLETMEQGWSETLERLKAEVVRAGRSG